MMLFRGARFLAYRSANLQCKQHRFICQLHKTKLSDKSPKLRSSRSVLRLTAKVLGVSSAIILAGGSYLCYTDEGFKRSVQFWRFTLPRFLHYKYIEYKTKNASDEEIVRSFQVLHDKYSPESEATCLELKGYYLKSAQMLSTMDGFIPEPYLSWCKKLQNEVPTELSEDDTRAIIEKSLRRKLDDIFSEFDFTPVGVASIGQVYKATLKIPYIDPITREKISVVAVKVQSPGIENRFRSDISTLQSFSAFAMPHFVPPLNEIEKQFLTEFDFMLEAKNLEQVQQNIMPFFGDKVKIPSPVKEFCTKDVLVMEFLEGDKFIDAIKNSFKKVAKFTGKSYEALEAEQIEKVKSGNLNSLDNEMKATKRAQAYIDTYITFKNALIASYNSTVGFFSSCLEYEPRLKLLNLAQIVEDIAVVHGHEIMVDGCVNGDPHPGNILLMDDGRLGLVDYGQVKHLPKSFRISYAKLILALCENDVDKVANIAYSDMGIVTKNYNKELTLRAMKFWNDNNSPEVLQGLNAYQFLQFLEDNDPVTVQCDDLIIPSRVSLILRGIGNAFGIDISMAKLWKPIAESVLAAEEP